MAIDPEKLQKAAEFGARMIPLVLKLRRARAGGVGVHLDATEVVTMIEIIQVLRTGPQDG